LSDFDLRDILSARLYGEAMSRGPEAKILLLNELLQRVTEEGTALKATRNNCRMNSNAISISFEAARSCD
jgi:hypothetical protein